MALCLRGSKPSLVRSFGGRNWRQLVTLVPWMQIMNRKRREWRRLLEVPDPSQTAPPARGQMFKYMRSQGTFHIQFTALS